jgi:hypothetical protein
VPCGSDKHVPDSGYVVLHSSPVEAARQKAQQTGTAVALLQQKQNVLYFSCPTPRCCLYRDSGDAACVAALLLLQVGAAIVGLAAACCCSRLCMLYLCVVGVFVTLCVCVFMV